MSDGTRAGLNNGFGNRNTAFMTSTLAHRVVRPFEDGGEFRLLLVGGEDEQVIAGVQGGVRADRDQLLVADDEADPHVDGQVCEFFDRAAVGW